LNACATPSKGESVGAVAYFIVKRAKMSVYAGISLFFDALGTMMSNMMSKLLGVCVFATVQAV
jgi:hypothetical protein